MCVCVSVGFCVSLVSDCVLSLREQSSVALTAGTTKGHSFIHERYVRARRVSYLNRSKGCAINKLELGTVTISVCSLCLPSGGHDYKLQYREQ